MVGGGAGCGGELLVIENINECSRRKLYAQRVNMLKLGGYWRTGRRHKEDRRRRKENRDVSPF